MRALMLAVLLSASCTTAPELSTTALEARSEVEQVVPDEVSPQVPTCPTEWTCDSVNFFATQPQCVGACGGQPCFQEQDCSARTFCECR